MRLPDPRVLLVPTAVMLSYCVGMWAGRASAPRRSESVVAHVTASSSANGASQEATKADETMTAEQWEEVVDTLFNCPDGKPSRTIATKRKAKQEEAKHEEKRAARQWSASDDLQLGLQRQFEAKGAAAAPTPELPRFALGAAMGLGLDGRTRYQGDAALRLVGPLWGTLTVDVTGRAALLGLRWSW